MENYYLLYASQPLVFSISEVAIVIQMYQDDKIKIVEDF